MSSEFEDQLLHTYSVATLYRLVLASPASDGLGDTGVSFLSGNLVAKYDNPDAVEDALQAMEVARQLGIRVPDVKRVSTDDHRTVYVMDRIRGVTLEEAWTSLGWLSTLRLAMQLRRWIRLLRSVTAPTAGSLATGKCRSFWLDDHFDLPPRAKPEDITAFIRFWTNFVSTRKEFETKGKTTAAHEVGIQPIAGPFVLTHGDLAPRNMMLDHFGHLWLIDWDASGLYPVHFEYAGMHNFDMPDDWSLLSRLRWFLFARIAAGRYPKEMDVLTDIRSKFDRCSHGRRFELLKNGGPSRVPVRKS